MTRKRFEILFSGRLKPGVFLESAVTGLAASLKTDEARAQEILEKGEGVIFESDFEIESRNRLREMDACGLEVMLRDGGVVEAGKSADRTGAPWPETAGPGRLESLPFEFTGTGGGYFRIWLVNVLLSVVTLGIYSAWAKVRRIRYFHSHTLLGGQAFEYLADPVRILKGRLLAGLVLAIVWLGLNFVPVLGLVLFFGLWLLTPWVIIRSLKFNLGHTAWKGIRFRFDATYGQAFKAYALWPLLSLFTLGALWPMAARRRQAFIINHTFYGTSRFSFQATTGQYYKLFLGTLPSLIIGLIIGGVVLIVLAPKIGFLAPAMMWCLIVLCVLASYLPRAANLVFNHTFIGRHAFESAQRTSSFARLVLVNALVLLSSLFLLRPWVVVRIHRYHVSHLRMRVKGGLDDFTAAPVEEQSAFAEEMNSMLDLEPGLV